jgi:hypothetical protein
VADFGPPDSFIKLPRSLTSRRDFVPYSLVDIVQVLRKELPSEVPSLSRATCGGSSQSFTEGCEEFETQESEYQECEAKRKNSSANLRHDRSCSTCWKHSGTGSRQMLQMFIVSQSMSIPLSPFRVSFVSRSFDRCSLAIKFQVRNSVRPMHLFGPHPHDVQ